jgi:isoleucyl-tRNA synthetase
VFESGWVKIAEQWRCPELAQKWTQLRDLRQAANLALEQARVAKAIGSSLEAKLLISAEDEGLRSVLTTMNSGAGNGVDELRYLFLTSEVEMVDGVSAEYRIEENGVVIGVVKAEGEKCDRCWNYSSHVGESAEHPLLCERCVEVV